MLKECLHAQEINKRNGVGDGPKAWCVVGCDGLPYTLGTKLLEKNKELQNIILIPGTVLNIMYLLDYIKIEPISHLK